MTAAKLNRKIIADNLRFMTITPSMDVDFTAGELSVSIFWHEPSINVAWYPIIQIDEGDKTIYHRDGAESMGPFCTAWSKFLFDAADFLEEVTA